MTNTNATLYIVATPIGNLQDITLRALQILKDTKYILAEDTRVTGVLLSRLNIKDEQKLISCHDFNESQRIEEIKKLLDNGDDVALVSDAGTPLISDPGYKIVSELRNCGYNIVPIPGVSAAITALSAAGLASDSFIFKGFLSSKKSKRQEQISSIKELNSTVIIYESVHRIMYLLEDIEQVIPDAKVIVAKEITKQFERFIGSTATEIKQFFIDNPKTLKGEFVVLIENIKQDHQDSKAIECNTLLKELMQELPLKKAVALTTKILNLKKNEVYQQALDMKDNNDAN